MPKEAGALLGLKVRVGTHKQGLGNLNLEGVLKKNGI